MSEPSPPPPEQPGAPSDSPPPIARVASNRSWLGWYWLLPLLTAGVVSVVLTLAWSRSGVTITLSFKEGHGLKPGDALRCRGIIIGEVRRVRLDAATGGVKVQVELQPDAASVARSRSLFWIARPMADFASGLHGLDTLVGAKYLVVMPGDGEPRTDFVGEEMPPIPETIEAGGLEVVLLTPHPGGLHPGAPVKFRQMRVGSVLGTALASDASAVHVRVYIRPTFARLVRDNTRFWNVSGMQFRAGVTTGVTFSLESIAAVLAGGVAMATPAPPGKLVTAGHRFRMESEEPEEWRKWQPSLPLTDARLPEGTTLPRPVPAVLRYQESGWLWGSTAVLRRGLVVPVGRDLLGPADVMTVPAKHKGELALTLQPPVTVKPEEAAKPAAGLVRLANVLERPDGSGPLLRIAAGPEDCLLVAAGQELRLASAPRLTEKDGRWQVDAELFRDATAADWHGAAVVAVKDGRLVGVLTADQRKAPPYEVLLLDKKLAQPPAAK